MRNPPVDKGSNSEAVVIASSRFHKWFDRARRVVASKNWKLVLWWYCLLLLLAIVSKYIETGWGDLLHSGSSGTHGPFGTLIGATLVFRHLSQVYRADVLQVTILVATAAVVLSGILRARLAAVAWICLSAASLVAFVEWLSLQQTGMPLTHANLVISLDWAREHPEVIQQVVPWHTIAIVAVLSIAYGSIPYLMTRTAAGSAFPSRVSDWLYWAASCLSLVLVAFELLSPGPIIPTLSQTLSPNEGFWSSSIASLAGIDTESPLNLPVESRDSLMRQYDRIAYPFGRPSAPMLKSASLGARVLRNIIVVVLETAPREYYRIADDSSYPTFHRMSEHAIVSERHFTNRPSTLFAIYSMLTGTYPRPGAPIGEYGSFRLDGLASTLSEHGYHATYIDSYRVDWGYHYRAELENRGFTTMLDTDGFHEAPESTSFATAVARERWSMGLAVRSVAVAQSEHKKALVVVATTLGHFPWRAPSSAQHESSADKIHRIATDLDSAVGILLHGLDSLHVKDSTIVVVTGDHGLRYTAEWNSFGLPNLPGADIEFNVPFMLYAPSLVKTRIDVPQATSHIDIAPTLYYLLGLPADSLLIQGENMLDTRLADRVVFLMNTGIYPVDAFEFRGHRFTSNAITGESHITPPLTLAERARHPWTSADVRRLIDAANHTFNSTAAEFLSRTRKKPTH